jgi:hypothetical protein
LSRAHGFQPENVLLMTDADPRDERRPRRNNIIGQLRGWSQRAAPADVFVVAFCGHAREIDGSVYLLPSDARAADLKMTGLSVEFVRSTLDACPARNKLLLLDACHSGSGRDVAVMTHSFAEQLLAEGITILSACKVNEVAHECEEWGHGAFSYFMGRGLEGAAADPSGAVTADGLYKYVHREVSRWAADRRLSQTPWRFSEGVGDPVLIGREPPAPQGDVERLSVPRFHYGSVVPPDYFIDREQELLDGQNYTDAGRSFLLVGERRAGKTSYCKRLIHQLMGQGDNRVLASYLNLQQCLELRIHTFLAETLINMVGEMARQVFSCKYTDLMRRDPAEVHPDLKGDPAFDAFVNIFRLAHKRTQSRGRTQARHLEAHDFISFVHDLLEVMRAKGWGSFVLFYDEANRLPGLIPIEMLVSNVEALSLAGVVSVYAASPEMAESFAPLKESFYEQVRINPFANYADMQRLLARYYFGDPTRIDDLPITGTALDLLWKLTAGKPYLIQLIAGDSFRSAQTRGAALVVDGDIMAARESVRARWPETFADGGKSGSLS